MSIKLHNVSKSYKGEKVLDGVSIDVPAASTLVLFGPSGAGKTVLLRAIAGAIELDDGRIELEGRDVTNAAPEHRGVGMAFQNFALFPHMSAFENVAAPLRARKLDRAAIEAGVHKVAKLLKIDHVLSHAPKALSNGQKQRTSLCRALAAEPKILLLDDPLRNVDAKLRFEMRLELPRLLGDQGATVIYVTQDYKEAMALGDRIAVLEAGQITQIGTPEEIYLRPAKLAIARLFGDPTINALDVEIHQDEQGVFTKVSNVRLPLDAGFAGWAGHQVKLGFRPEAADFSSDPKALPVAVEAETPLNEKTVSLVTTLRGREILVSRPSGTIAPVSGQAMITIDPAALMLFDASSGGRLAAKPGVAQQETAA